MRPAGSPPAKFACNLTPGISWPRLEGRLPEPEEARRRGYDMLNETATIGPLAGRRAGVIQW